MVEIESRIKMHDRLIALSYGHGIGCGVLTDDEARGLRRLAQMVIRGVIWFEAKDFGKPLGWDETYSASIIEGLLKKYPQRKVMCDDGDAADVYYSNAANIGVVECIITEFCDEHTIYNFLIDGVASHFAREMGCGRYE